MLKRSLSEWEEFEWEELEWEESGQKFSTP